MNLNALEKKADFFNGLKTLFASLNVPVNYIDEKSIAPKEILSKTFKENIEAYQLMDDVFILGMVDNAAFEGKKSETIVGIEKGKKDYDGILLFGVTLKNRDKGLLPTRSQLSEITRAFNREFHYTPVVVVFKYEHYISIANAERITYKQEWREGEKTGKVSILRDINVNKPHTGHLKILQELTISRTGKGAVNTFAALYTYWQSVFNVSILNKQFYKELSDWYFWALQEVAFPATNYASDKNSPLKEEERVKEHNAKNLIRMLTRLLFVWFVKEKNLIPEELFDETYIRDNLINGFEPRKKKGFDHKAQGGKYYRAILQNLFFATLNQTVGKREFRKDGQQMNVTNLMRYESYFKTPKAFIKLVEDVVPFMNGGLFECLDSPDPLLKGKRGGDVIIYEDGFSDRKDNSLCVPDYIFFGTDEHADLSGELGDKKQKDVTVNGLINILKSYKFTVTENTPIEEDIALDPELLGRVFENLLASYNPETKTTARKQTGSFYTPREIVNYMVDESLKAYLKQKLEPVGQAFLPVHETIYETVYETNNIKKTKRHLPHWHLNGSYYFITFRKKVTPPCLTETERKIVIDHIIKGNGTFYELVCTVVMPDHVHIILKPERNYDLSGIMKGIKGISANLINKVNKTTGTVWQDESFDRIIRNEKEFFEKINYMYNNPIKKGMIEKTEDYTGWFLKTFLSDNYKEGQTGMSVLPLSIENRLNDLFSYADNPNPFTDEETRILINAIDNCKIIDPACGSGAFPMGILHKLVHVLHKLDANNVLWKEVQRKKAIKETEEAFQIGNKEERENRLKEISDVFEHNSDDYGRKLYLIENCIYGVDIQPIATQISKLRFFISLIVDQKTDKTKNNFGIRPLPNLETKFVAANTLIGIEKPRGFLRNIELDKLEESLKAVRHRLFSAKTPAKKRKLRDEDQRLREELGKFLENAGWRNESAKQVASWDPYNQNVSSQFFDPEWMFGATDGFDVVIGNPPYISALDFSKIYGKNLREKLNSNFQSATGTYDYFVLFIEQGLRLCKKSALLCFITPNKYLSAKYAEGLRSWVLGNATVLKILDVSKISVFEEASVYPIVSIFRKDNIQLRNVKAILPETLRSDVFKIEDYKTYLIPYELLKILPQNIWGFILSKNVLLLNSVLKNTQSLSNLGAVNATSTAAEADEYGKHLSNVKSVDAKKSNKHGYY